MEVLAHFLDGQIENVAIETLNCSLEGKKISMSLRGLEFP
jgi:hypothetical protein